MVIDGYNLTPWTSLGGGILIGVAVTMLILLNGRVAGVCGIIGGVAQAVVSRQRRLEDIQWRVAFLAGLILAPVLWAIFSPLPPIRVSSNGALLAFAGFLVGIGSRYGSGCTSGHGVCGISRLSIRSVVATLLFMSAGFLTVYVVRHVLG